MFAALKLPLILKPPSPSPAGFPGEEHVFLIFLVIYQTWGECFIDGISNTISSASRSPRASSSSPPPGIPGSSGRACSWASRSGIFLINHAGVECFMKLLCQTILEEKKRSWKQVVFHGASKLFGYGIKNEFEDCREGNLSLFTTDLTCQSIIM